MLKLLKIALPTTLLLGACQSPQKEEPDHSALKKEVPHRDTSTVDSSAYYSLFAQVDTINKWIEERPVYETAGNSWSSMEIENAFMRATQRLDSLFIDVLSNPLSYDIDLFPHLRQTKSVDSKILIISYGSANISGTGRFHKNIIQIKNGDEPIAYVWEELQYDMIDTLKIADKICYIFPARHRSSTWYGAFSIKAYSLDSILVPVENNMFLGSNHLNLEFNHSWKDEQGNEYTYDLAKEFIYYNPKNKEIRINHPDMRIDREPFKQIVMHNGGETRYNTAYGKLDLILEFDQAKNTYQLDSLSNVIYKMNKDKKTSVIE